MIAMDKKNPFVKRPIGFRAADIYVVIDHSNGNNLPFHAVGGAVCLSQIAGAAALEEQVVRLPSEFRKPVVHGQLLPDTKGFGSFELCLLLYCERPPMPLFPCEYVYLVSVLFAWKAAVSLQIFPCGRSVVSAYEIGDPPLAKPMFITKAIAAQDLNQLKFPFQTHGILPNNTKRN